MEAEAKEIGIQLQSLLKIPPIQKSGTQTAVEVKFTQENISDSSSSFVPIQAYDYSFKHLELENFHNRVDISTSLVFENRNLAKPEVDWRNHLETHNIDISFQVNHDKKIHIPSPPTFDVHLNKNISMSQTVLPPTTRNLTSVLHACDAPVLQKINDTTIPTATLVRNEPLTERKQRFQGKESSISYDKPRSKIVSQINELVRHENCPKNVARIKDKLIEACLQEPMPVPCLKMNKTVLELFKLHSVEPLTKKSTKFARARYFCSLCNYHLDTVTNVIVHVSNTRHKTNAKVKNMDHELQNIPIPSAEHQKSLHFFILEIMNSHGIGEGERSLRVGVLEKLNRMLGPHNIQLELFGSSVPGFGFSSSNINFNLDLTKRRCEGTNELLSNTEHGLLVTQLAKILQKFEFVKDVTEGEHVLQIKFADTDVNRNCSIQVNNISGMLLSRLFLEYDKLDWRVRPLVVAFRFWARIVEIDNQEVDLFPGHAYTIMVLKHLLDVGVIPYIIEPDDSVSFRRFIDSNEESTWKSCNNHSLGLLWLGLLRKYSLEFPMKELVVSLVQPHLLKSSDRTWNKKLSIEDPIIPKSNLSRSASSNRVCDYICDRIKYAYMYFGIPRMIGNVPLYEKVIPLGMVKHVESIYLFRKFNPIQLVAPILTESTHNKHLRKVVEKLQIHETIIIPPEDWSSVERIRMINMPDYKGDTKAHVITEDLERIHNVLVSEDYNYTMSKDIFQDGEEPPKHCRSCGADGHVRRSCPDEILPGLVPVSYPDHITLQVLEDVMYQVYDYESLWDADIQKRQLLIHDIFRSLVDCYPDVELILFGSTSNGFGLRGSDVDICVRFKNNPICKADFRSEHVAKRLKVVVDRLRSSGCMTEVLAIPSAKVPIVKFKHKVTKLEGDISFSNELALRNTQLLRAYVEIDPRVKILGCFLKQLTKLCDISDASKGSLSSYGYVLMLIHFLQQHNPPVLPILQQIPAVDRPEYLVDGWDSYFFCKIDASTLSQQWNGFRSNHESVAQLFLAFINYYTEIFNFETKVVTISQIEPLSRKQKIWTTSTLICIEDPFEKCHNLGAGLTRRMSVFILKTLQKFREVFFRSIFEYSPHIDYVSVFLDPTLIRGTTNPPIDRQCRNCNRIGHFANTCNYRTRNGDTSPDSTETDLFGDLESLIPPHPTSDSILFEKNSRNPGLESRHLPTQGQSPVNSFIQPRAPISALKMEQNVNTMSPELHNSTNINSDGNQVDGQATRLQQLHEFHLENAGNKPAIDTAGSQNYQTTPGIFPTLFPITAPSISNPISFCPPPGFEFMRLKNNKTSPCTQPSAFVHIPEITLFAARRAPPLPRPSPSLDTFKFMQPNPADISFE